MQTVCKKNMCSGCMACTDICPKNAIKICDELSLYNAVIDENKCINCGLCHKICQTNNTPNLIKPKHWYQGWAKDVNIRSKSSSGGLATAISLSFIEKGGVVYSCCFENGEFIFSKATNKDELYKFVGSKYVKSNPKGVYNSIKNELIKGKKVLFIGLPCQCAALKNYISEGNQEQLFTVDLICHGTPSPKLLERFINQYKKSLDSLSTISFRVKGKMQLHGDDQGMVAKGVSDKYTIAFVNGLTYTENCYECSYAKLERVSDITLGDSWGSDLPVEDIKKGISLILCQTEKGKKMLDLANVELRDVDQKKAISHNQQLRHPSVKPKRRDLFFKRVKDKKNINKEIFKCFPGQCIKQDIKEKLIQMHIIK